MLLLLSFVLQSELCKEKKAEREPLFQVLWKEQGYGIAQFEIKQVGALFW